MAKTYTEDVHKQNTKQAIQYIKNWPQIEKGMDTNSLQIQALKYKIKSLPHVQILDTDYRKKHYNINKIGYNMYRGWTQTD